MIRTRPATPSDVPLIRELIHDLATYEREPHSVRITEEQLLQDGFGPDRYYECLIAEYDGTTAGFTLFFPVYSTWRGSSLHLEDLFVRPQFRGQGVGKALLTRVAAIAVERGCTRLQWHVLAWNRLAIDFYRNSGATLFEDWRRMQVTDDALAALAAGQAQAETGA